MTGGRRMSRGVWVALGVAVVLAACIYAGLNGRRGADAALKRAPEAAAVPTVKGVSPSTSSPSHELVPPGPRPRPAPPRPPRNSGGGGSCARLPI